MRALLLGLILMSCSLPGLADEGYEISSGDVIHVIVLGQEALTGDFIVDVDGTINYPFLGKVKASDMTPPELERKLTTLLSDGYLKKPQVAVTLKETRSQRVFVTGEVRKPGPYALRTDRSLLSLLEDVGELTPNAGHEVLVIRPPKINPEAEEPVEGPPPKREGPALPGEAPGSEVFRVSLLELRSGNPEKDLPLEARDTVYFPRAAQIYVTGHVARPGAYRYEDGLTVFQALALAGGVSERGSSKVKILRIMEGKKKEFGAKPTDLVQPEDTIKVPERFF